MEHVLCEPVELTEFELDSVAGGNPFGSVTGNTTNLGVAFSNGFNANAIGTFSEAETAIVDIVNSTATSNFLNG
jgi:hypothetical protein